MLDPAPLYRIDAFTRIELKNRQSPSFVVTFVVVVVVQVVDRVSTSRIIQRTSPASVPRVRVVSSTFPLEVVACNTVRNPRTPSSSSSSHRRRRRRRHPSSVIQCGCGCGCGASSSSSKCRKKLWSLCFAFVCVFHDESLTRRRQLSFFKRLFLGGGRVWAALRFFRPRGKLFPLSAGRQTDE